MTPHHRLRCPHCGRANGEHDWSDFDDAGLCLAGAELPSRPAYTVVALPVDDVADARIAKLLAEKRAEPARRALSVLRGADNEDGERDV